ncbi:MAG: hypothetical protein U0175_21830 [Caldilineaceae bacterium]
MKTSDKSLSNVLGSGLLLVLVFFWTLSVPTKSVRAELPPLPSVTPRPTVVVSTPVAPTATALSLPASTRVPVAVLRLKLQNSVERPLSSVVQWQDTSGNWHDIDGWRGQMVKNQTTWWVEEKDWGDGPFRWSVYTQESGAMLAISEPFHLPSRQGEELTVSVRVDTLP